MPGIFAEIFSLTGAAFNYSSYQHPRRDREIKGNSLPTGYSIAREANVILVICNFDLFNLCFVFSNAKVCHFEKNGLKNYFTAENAVEVSVLLTKLLSSSAILRSLLSLGTLFWPPNFPILFI